MNLWEIPFTTALKGARQTGDMAGWGCLAFGMLERWATLWENLCGSRAFTSQSLSGIQAWTRALEEFRKSMMLGYRSFWGMMPPDEEHLELVKKYEDLEEKAASLEETVAHLRTLLDASRQEMRREPPYAITRGRRK